MQYSKLHRSRVSRLVLSTAIAAGVGLCSQAYAGIAVTFGNNSTGQLGNGGSVSSNVPVYVSGLSGNVSAGSGGSYFTLAIDNGAVKAWGSGSQGRLGNGFTSDSTTPVNVIGLSTGVTSVASGLGHGLAIQNGAVKSWGHGWDGQLGNGQFDTNLSTPVNVVGLSSGVTAISAGTFHSVAIQNGAAKTWGYNVQGQLGNGGGGRVATPVDVIGLSSGVTSITAGSYHNVAIQNGAAKAWGLGANGRLGNGGVGSSSAPVDVTGLSSGVTAVAAGVYHSLAIQNGNVYAWGRNAQGELGNFSTTDSSLPILVLNLPVDLVAVAAGDGSSYAITADGKLYAWGWGIAGQLGFGDFDNRYRPALVPAPEGYQYSSIAAGNLHAIATIVAIPEPASLSLLAMGGAAMLRRKRRA